MALVRTFTFAVGIVLACLGCRSAPELEAPRRSPATVVEVDSRWSREPTLTYLRTEIDLSSAPEVEPDWREDILELRNTTSRAVRFATVFEDGFPGGVGPASRAGQERRLRFSCSAVLRTRTLAPGESFVMRAASDVVGPSRAWMCVWDASSDEPIELLSDEYDSSVAAPTVRPADRN